MPVFYFFLLYLFIYIIGVHVRTSFIDEVLALIYSHYFCGFFSMQCRCGDAIFTSQVYSIVV
jgi:hypothetical protein